MAGNGVYCELMNPDVPNSSSLPTPEPAAAGGAPAPSNASHHHSTPPVAADTDRIEQQWVLKVKQVLLATRNDPHEQNRQLAILKADYMRKRYNKEIKLGE